MKILHYLAYLLNVSLFANGSLSIRIDDVTCEQNGSLTWLWNLRNNNRCLYLTSSFIIPKCFFDQILSTKFVVRTISPRRLLNRNIYNSTRSNCDNFLVFSGNLTFISELFRQKGNEKRFMPFSQIYLSVPDTIGFDNGTIEYIHRNALNVFLMENVLSKMENGLIGFESMLNVLTKNRFIFTSNRRDVVAFVGTYKDHPLLSNKSSKKIFRVSLFNCPPYVVYVSGNNNT